MRALSSFFVCAALLVGDATTAECKKIDGKFEVTAKLVEVPGKFPPDDLYDYAYVMRYTVIGGKLDGKTIYVAHYKPRRARNKIRDKMKKYVAGKLKRFKEGAVHKLVLAPLKNVWKGAVEDKFFSKDRKSPRFWCLQADRAKK
jgi:hypothetical protein